MGELGRQVHRPPADNAGLREAANATVQGAIGAGMVVLDIGANIGYYGLIAARIVGRDGKR